MLARAPLGPCARLLGLALVLLSLGCPRPGEGRKAEAGYRRAAPIIAALERYRSERGSYPDSLASLPPEWLPEELRGSAPRYGLHYERKDDRYELTFSYGGPGINHCTYDPAAPEARRWSCGGYY
jgi:hypothetical protein